MFHSEYNKAAFRVFDTNLKLEELNRFIELQNKIIRWEKDDSNKITQGVLRNLLYFSKIMKDYEENGDTSLLMWHPKLNYMINRLLKDKDGKYQNNEINSFFDNALSINKNNSNEGKELQKFLYPLICETIYGTRNNKGD